MNRKYTYKNIIVGAGFAGIGAAYAAQRNNEDTVILEKNNDWGGLCGNFVIDDFWFDKAVHLSFSNIKTVQNIFYKTEHVEHAPESKNYTGGYWVRHPIQNNCCSLPISDRIKIIKSFVTRKPNANVPQDYKEYLTRQFGKYFSKKYSEKYTRKYWASNAEELNCSWCGSRIYIPTLNEVLKGAFTNKGANTYYAKTMRYPRHGAYRSFLTKIVDTLSIQYNKKITNINPYLKQVRCADGCVYKYNNLISTVPLPELCKLFDKTPKNVLNASKELQSTSMCLVSIGLKKKVNIPSLWFYVYDEEIPFARVHSPSMKFAQNCPKGCSSLQCEIYYSENMPLQYSDEQLKNKTVQSIISMNIAKEDDILFADIRHVKYANVIFYHGIEKHRKICREWVESLGIKTAGRFGKWDYL